MSAHFLSKEDQKEHALIMAKILERYARALRGGRFKFAGLNRLRNVQQLYFGTSGGIGHSDHGVTWELDADTSEGRIKATLEESPKQFHRAENRRRAKG